DKILILDFGSQVTQLIARRVREAGVYCEIKPYSTKLEEIKKFAPKGLILSGGPASVSFAKSPTVDKKIFDLKLPILGICYGQQLMAHLLGGKVEGSSEREFGRAQISVKKDSALTKDVWKKGSKHQVWMSHGDKVTKLPKGFEVLAATPSAPCAIIADEKRKIYGVQFHPEVAHTPE